MNGPGHSSGDSRRAVTTWIAVLVAVVSATFAVATPSSAPVRELERQSAVIETKLEVKVDELSPVRGLLEERL